MEEEKPQLRSRWHISRGVRPEKKPPREKTKEESIPEKENKEKKEE